MNFVTELDVEIPAGHDELDRQADAYRTIAEIWLKHHGGGWLQTWGVYDKHTWLGPAKRPLLLDEEYRPKPAYNSLYAALTEATDADFNADGEIDGADLINWQQRFEDDLDGSDLYSWVRQFGRGADGGESSVVPEPRSGAITAAAAATAGLAYRVTRRRQ